MFGGRPFGTRGFGDSTTQAVQHTYTVASVEDTSHSHESQVAVFPNPEYVSGGFGARPLGTRSFGDSTGVPVSVIRVDAGIPSEEGVGRPTLWSTTSVRTPVTLFGEVGQFIYPASIPSSEGVGSPTITGAGTAILPLGIPGDEAFGTPTVWNKAQFAQAVTLFGEVDTTVTDEGVLVWSIHSEESFGVPRVLVGGVVSDAGAIPSEEAFGVPVLTVAGSLGAWMGPSPQARYTPVTVGNVDHLTGCVLDDGRGMLMWRDVTANEVRIAILAEPELWLQDGIIDTVPEYSVAYAPGGVVHSVSCWNNHLGVFFSVLRRHSNVGYYQIFKANDPSDPTSGWTLYSTVRQVPVGPSSDLFSHTMAVTGVPVNVGGSNWIITGGRWQEWGVDVFAEYYFCHAGLWTSANDGVTWTQRMNVGYYLIGGSYIDYIGPQVHRDPNNSFLYWNTGGGPFLNGHWIESRDNGVTWSAAVYFTAVAGGDWVGGEDGGLGGVLTPDNQNPMLIPFSDWDGNLLVFSLLTEDVTKIETTGDQLVTLGTGTKYIGGFHPASTKVLPVRPLGLDEPRLVRTYVFTEDTVQAFLPGFSIKQIQLG
jgi:hypothetical protein